MSPQYGKRVRPKTYSVAVYLVAAILLLQVGMLISVFWLRAMVVSVNVRVPKPKNLAANGPGGLLLPPISTKPDMPRLPALSATTTQSARLTVPGLTDELEQVGADNEEAQVLLHQNDLKHAAEVLKSAEDLDPSNPATLKSLAETYYLMNDSVRAKQYWQRLADLGPGVGTVYALAKDHVLLLDSTADANTILERSSFPRGVYIDEVEKTPLETTNGQPQFRLQAFLMRRDSESPFDQKKLQVYVIFYQRQVDGQLGPDLTQRKGSFNDTFLFWHSRVREPFGVNYVMPTPDVPGSGNPPSGKYYGFVIGIYYNKILQDARSEPTDLINREPLPDAIE